jgi:hypothetical protein
MNPFVYVGLFDFKKLQNRDRCEVIKLCVEDVIGIGLNEDIGTYKEKLTRATARSLFIYLSRKHTTYEPIYIARYVGMDRSSLYKYFKRFSGKLSPALKQNIAAIENKFDTFAKRYAKAVAKLDFVVCK